MVKVAGRVKVPRPLADEILPRYLVGGEWRMKKGPKPHSAKGHR